MRQKQSQTTQNTHAFLNPPDTADISALRGMKAHADTSIPYNYAVRREELNNSYTNPLGSATSPAVREAAQRAAGRGLAMGEAQAVQNSQQEAENTNFGRQATVAGFTNPHLVQTGGTSIARQGDTTWGTLLGLA